MPKKLISFLGTTKYSQCHYSIGARKTKAAESFVQAAIAELNCADWTNQDSICLFVTEEAQSKNWPELEKRLNELNLWADIKAIPIPTATQKDATEASIHQDIMQVFERLNDELKEGDEVILDITHAFRFFPLLGIVVLNYAKALKNISIKHIYYGAFEVLGNWKEVEEIPLEKREAPIVDFMSFAALQDWARGVNEFVRFGSADTISKLTSQELSPILREAKGSNQTASNLQAISKSLNTISNQLLTSRGNSIGEASEFAKLKKLLKETQAELVKPLKPVLAEVHNKISPFQKYDAINNGFAAVRWCIDHKLIQQGYTLLVETVLTVVAQENDLDSKAEFNRNISSSAMNIANAKIEKENWKKEAAEKPELCQQIIDSSISELFRKEYGSLSRRRNDLAHAGYIEAAQTDPNKFVAGLKSDFEKIYKQYLSYCADKWENLTKSKEEKYGCTAEQRASQIYEADSHTWEEEEELIEWRDAESLAVEYQKELEQWS